jgi:hypothetical protein
MTAEESYAEWMRNDMNRDKRRGTRDDGRLICVGCGMLPVSRDVDAEGGDLCPSCIARANRQDEERRAANDLGRQAHENDQKNS